MKITIQNLWDAAKAVLRGKFIRRSFSKGNGKISDKQFYLPFKQ